MTVRGRLQAIELWSGPVCAGTRLATLTDYRDPVSELALDNSDSCSFVLNLDNPANALLVEGTVIVYQYETVGGVVSYDEWLFTDIERAQEYGSSSIRVNGRSFLFYIARSGLLAQWTDGGVPLYEFSDTRTVQDWCETYVIPALERRGYTFVTFGVSDYPDSHTLSVAHQNGLDILNQLKAKTQGEYRLRRNGVVGYELDFVQAINGSADTLRVFSGRSLASARVASSAVDLATRLVPLGSLGCDAINRTIARTRWRISALDGVNGDATVESPDGDADLKCIHFDGQFTTNAGLPDSYWIVCLRSGRAFQLTNTYQATQKLRVASLGDLVVGDEIEFRVDQSGLVRTDYCGAIGAVRYSGRVSSVSSNDVTLADQWAEDPVQADDEWNGLRYEALSSIANLTFTVVTSLGGGQSRITVASTTGLAVGDLVVFTGTDNSSPYTPTAPAWLEITNVQSGTQFDVRYWYKALGASDLTLSWANTYGATQYLWVYRARSNVAGYVNDCVAGTNVVTVTAPANIANNDLLVFFRMDGGTRLTTLPSPHVLEYGEAERPYTRDDLRGEFELLNGYNPQVETWTTTPGAPDQWTSLGGTITRSTTLIGPGAVYSISGSNCALRTSPVRGSFSAGDSLVCVRGRLKVPGGASWVSGISANCRVGIFVRTTTGQVEVVSYNLKPSGDAAAAAPSATEYVAPDTTTEVSLVLDLLSLATINISYAVRFGLGAVVGLSTGGSVALCGGVTLQQSTAAAEAGFYCKTQRGNTLWHEGQVKLALVDEPLRTYEFGLHDFSRLQAGTYADEALDIGVPVLAESARIFGTAPPTKRVVRIRYHHTHPALTTVEVEGLPEHLTPLLARLTNE